MLEIKDKLGNIINEGDLIACVLCRGHSAYLELKLVSEIREEITHGRKYYKLKVLTPYRKYNPGTRSTYPAGLKVSYYQNYSNSINLTALGYPLPPEFREEE